MRNARWWLLVAVLVAVAAFVSCLVRGVTGTAPFDVDEAARDLKVHAA